VAIGIAVAIHLLLMAAFVTQTGPASPPGAQPAIEVELTPALPAPRPRPVLPARPAPTPPATTTSQRQTSALAAASPPPAPPMSPPPPTLPASPNPEPNLAHALNGALGCGLPGLAPEARAHCRNQLAAGGPPGHAYGVGATQRTAFDAAADRALWWQKPFLATDPKNGCRPKVTHREVAAPGGHGTGSDWRVAMGCAVSF
jgi:hypothetical protein